MTIYQNGELSFYQNVIGYCPNNIKARNKNSNKQHDTEQIKPF